MQITASRKGEPRLLGENFIYENVFNFHRGLNLYDQFVFFTGIKQ